MSVKPAQTCTVTKGKLMGAQTGFADTFNWVTSCTENITGGKGCEVKNVNLGHPEIDVCIEPGEGINVQCGGPGQPYTISLVEPYFDVAIDLSAQGTDETMAVPLSSVIKFNALPDTNLSVTCENNAISIGVYWL